MQTIHAPRQTATQAIERVPRWARWFVRSFLAVFIVCAAVGIEAWPLTGFRLFSHLRHERQTEWQAFAVRPDGRETRLRLSRVPGGYNGFPLVMKSFSSHRQGERDQMCRAWTVAASLLERETVAVRIYRIDRRLEPRNGRRPMTVPKRSLVYTCGSGNAGDEVASAAG